MKKTNKVFMAFATGQESKEGGSIKRFIGIAPVFVIGVNPTKSELEKLYGGINIENEPEYIGTSEIGPEGNKKTVEQVRIDFIVKTDPEKSNGIEMTTKISFFLKKAFRFNGDQTKCQVIDKYGRTAWVTSEELKIKAIPQYKNGPANLDVDYRPAYIGEDELTEFIKTYLNIPNPQNFVGGKWVDKTPAEKVEAEARLDKIETFFKNDVKELKTIIGFQPNNKIKVMFGVKTTDDNKMYQAVYMQKFLRNGVNDYTKIEKELSERKAEGAYPSTEFSASPIKEYVVGATNFNDGDLPGSDNPFASAGFPV